jgi:hypothetical protein
MRVLDACVLFGDLVRLAVRVDVPGRRQA